MDKNQKEFFKIQKEEKEEMINLLKQNYSVWRDEKKKYNYPFYLIHTDFEPLFLKDITGGALKLYLYIGFRAKYQTGEMWENVETISEFFEKDARTINKWFKELEEIGLITRIQKGFKTKTITFMKPYGYILKTHFYNSDKGTEAIEEIVHDSESKNLEPNLALILNYGFKEYTILLVFKFEQDPLYIGYYLIDYHSNPEKQDDINIIKKDLRNLKFKTDIHDIEAPVSKSKNVQQYIYKELLKYLNEQE